MINPLPFNSCDKSTLLPGVVSNNSREGIESPVLTILKRVWWKVRMVCVWNEDFCKRVKELKRLRDSDIGFSGSEMKVGQCLTEEVPLKVKGRW